MTSGSEENSFSLSSSIVYALFDWADKVLMNINECQNGEKRNQSQYNWLPTVCFLYYHVESGTREEWVSEGVDQRNGK